MSKVDLMRYFFNIGDSGKVCGASMLNYVIFGESIWLIDGNKPSLCMTFTTKKACTGQALRMKGKSCCA